MKLNKKVLVAALSLGLLVSVPSAQADGVNNNNVIEQTVENEQIKQTIAKLEKAIAKNETSYNNAIKRLNEKIPNESQQKVLDKSIKLRKIANDRLEKLKNLLKEEELSKEDENKPSEENPTDKENKPSDEKDENPSKEEPSNPDKPEEPGKDEEKEEKPQDETVTKTERVEIPFKTFRAINDPNTETKLKDEVQGQKGYIEYEVTYKNGEEIDRKETHRQEPVNQTILTKVKVKDAVIRTKEVDDETKPIYDIVGYKDAYFVAGTPLEEWTETGIENPRYWYFETYGEAQDFASNNKILGNYGDNVNPTQPIKKLIGYEQKTVEYEVTPAVYEWK